MLFLLLFGPRGGGRQKSGALLLGRITLVEHVHLGHAQGALQVLQGLLRFIVLLVQEIVKDVLISLNESLRVLLSVFELFVSVSLDALQQGREGQLLCVSQLRLLLLKHALHL